MKNGDMHRKSIKNKENVDSAKSKYKSEKICVMEREMRKSSRVH